MNPLGTLDEFPAANKSTYLNTASVALMYAPADTAIAAWQKDLAENGTINFDEQAEQDVFDKLHHAFSRLIGAQPTDIAVASSTTELLASLAWAIYPKAGSNIVSTDIVFPSTIYPWARVARHSGAELRFLRDQDDFADQNALIELIDQNTAVVCVSHVEYGSGQRYDLKKLADAVHAYDGLLIVDATQSAGGVPIDVIASDVDALVCGGYKWLCGPFGAAVMYLAPKWQTSLDPGLVGFRSNKDIWKFQADYMDFSDNASRFEFSTMAYGCAIGLAKTIDYLSDTGIDNIYAHNLKLADKLLAGLDSLNAQIISPKNEQERTSIVSCRFPGKVSIELIKALNEANIVASPRRDFMRFSPHLYNSSADIDHTLEELKRILKQ